jgi:hypothetical protein
MFDTVKDSGVREEMPTGSRRDTREGKGRYDLLPTFGLHRLAAHFENGSKKYGDRNWEIGQPLARMVDSALRHAFEYLQGRADEDHLAAAVWNLICALDAEERIRRGLLPATLDDLPGNPTGIDASPLGSNLSELRMRLRESGFCEEPVPLHRINPEYLKIAPLYDLSKDVDFILPSHASMPVTCDCQIYEECQVCRPLPTPAQDAAPAPAQAFDPSDPRYASSDEPPVRGPGALNSAE